ncbi:MAG: AAA family ATPase [Desulfobacterium sp.]|nr:AAA family ATPase [Desulfobacterium sp.]
MMRILQVRFKNLNSLAGEWEIDLTHPAFASDGIFAITGPTGAGKTTILDAICLALYGRTPRLNKVTRSGNEIMSRQTGECFAEVTFETQAGRFRCHWSQHRARKKPDGELQSPKHEIADADSGKIFEAKIRGVAEQIETATGMDFDRFTRSMLLAQGGFAAFLQAAPDERAPILEQITGTEIYSRISIRVHERRSEERNKLETLQAELKGMQLLNEEDEKQLKSDLEHKILNENNVSQQITQNNQAISWLDNIVSLEKELCIIDEQKQNWLTRQKAFLPELEKLNRANQALELAGEFAVLTSLRCEQEADSQSHSKCLQTLPENNAEVKLSEDTLKTAGVNLEKKKIEQKAMLPVIRKVRELDLNLREKETPIKTTGDLIAELEKSIADLRLKNGKDLKSFKSKKNALEEILQHLADTKTDEGLVENLAVIRSRFDALKDLNERHLVKIKELAEAETKKAEAIKAWSKQEANLKAGKNELDTILNALDKKQTELNKVLAGREIADWRNIFSELKEKKALLEKLSESVQSLTETRRVLDVLISRHEPLSAEKDLIAQQLQTQTEKVTVLEREMHLLETQLSLHKKIRDFENARQQLEDGQTCPLCGAIEHPFAKGNIPVPDKTTAELKLVRAGLKKANDSVSDMKVKQAQTQKELEQIATRKKECTEWILTAQDRIHLGLSALFVETSGQDPESFLPALQKENKENLDSVSKIIQSSEGFEKEIVSLLKSHEKIKEAVLSSERNTQTSNHRKDSAEQAVERAQKDTELLAAWLVKTQVEVLQDILPYGIKSLSADTLDLIRLELKSRRDLWLAKQKEKIALEQQISTLKLQTQHQAEQINKSETELKKQQDAYSTLLRELETLAHERRELFGHKNPDDEETRLSAAIEDAEKDIDATRQLLNKATQKLGKLKNRIEELEKSITARAERLKTVEEAFGARLGTFGFTDEACYLTACLPEDKRKNLMQQAMLLENEQTKLETRRKDKSELLETQRQKQVTDLSREQICKTIDDLVICHKELQQEIGGIRQKLKDNDSIRQKQQEKSMAIDAQKRESSRWDILHELIGSADGKKYRNFAQGLTFEMMIGHANRQLQKMTDRYLLIRDDLQPLELNVVDNYQAGEIRSTKNLSGGESFIVSLSLALGLSHMASKNVRVDSLFLDEGFGALDEEILDTALETLSGLQQDGKLIGVISHVLALKERINAQIQIIPQTGGRSVISGPGCGRSNHRANA